jgi:tetratricopeptide (TPR) repeat protein
VPRKTSAYDASDLRAVFDAGDPDALERVLAVIGDVDLEFTTAARNSIVNLHNSDPVRAHRLSGRLLEVASDSAKNTPYRSGVLATAWRSHAETSAYSGKLKDAKAAYATAHRFAQLHGDPSLRGQILVGQIGLLASLGDAEEANRLVPLASRLLREAGDSSYLARLHMNLGNAACHREDFQTARKEFAAAAKYFDQVEHPGPLRIGLEMNQGIVYAELSQVSDARQAFLNVEKKSQAFGLTHFVAQAQFNRGLLEGYFGDYRTALSLLERAEEAFRSEGALELIAGTELSRSEIYLELGMAQEARELARAAASGYDREEMALDAASSRFAEARALALLREFDTAGSLLRDLDAFYLDRKIRPRRAVVQLQLARVLVLQQDWEHAREVARRALASLSRLQIGTGTARARTLLAEIHLANDRPRASSSLLEPVL